MRPLLLRFPVTDALSGVAVALFVISVSGCNRAPAGETRPAAGSADGAGGASTAPPARLPEGDYTPIDEPVYPLPANDAARLRTRALARAQVWREPAIPIARADLLHNTGPLAAAPYLACRFFPKKPTGTTPKFECVLPGGAIVKVKYGRNPEIPAEVAASRLLTVLGFGADEMSLMPIVRCFGCPTAPYATLKVIAFAQALKLYESTAVDVTTYTDFHNVSVERRFAGAVIEHGDLKGWAWWELAKLKPAPGGAPRAHLDALRLLAVFLAHWDNKAENQRLVCLDDDDAHAECRRPFAFAHDLGATFGPMKADLGGWRATPIWADPVACVVSMKALPHDGATFPDARISEDGRRFLADRLRLTDAQIRDLFAGAQFVEHEPFYNSSSSRNLDAWVEVFKDKVRQIAERDPCPMVAPAATRRED